MRILITNDDGIKSEGLHILVKEMEKNNDVLVVAPDIQRSACGHSITLHNPIVVREVKIDGIKSRTFSVSGTPADCVKIAMEKLLTEKPDMVISGINYGLNIGTDVIYSGTVSAAIEGILYKIPSIALSMHIDNSSEDYDAALKYINEIILDAHKNNLKNDVVLNINMPSKVNRGILGIKVCQLGNIIYNNCYIETMLENNEVGFKLQGEAGENTDTDTDVYFINTRYITITPLHYDLTNFKVMREVENWFHRED